MRLTIVSANSPLAEVLAEEICEVRGVVASVIDIDNVESGEFRPAHDVTVVCELVLDRWCRWRGRLQSSPSSTEVIGALGSRWLLHESPESLGFFGCIDLKLPAHDLVQGIRTLREKSMGVREASAISMTMVDSGSPCQDDIDRRMVAYITLGLSDREIAAKVHLSSQTVRNRVSRMLERAHVENRTQLAMACMSDPSRMVIRRIDVATPDHGVSTTC